MNAITRYLSKWTWIQRFSAELWQNPNRLNALKLVSAMSVQVIPLVLLGKSFFGITLALGTVAAAIAETDDHPKGRIKALLLTLLSFLITTCSVVLLKPYPVIFTAGFILSTIMYVLIGGMGERYKGIAYGAILIGIYAMLGVHNSPTWYWEPVLLCGGALFYGLISLALLFFKPWRLLEEQLSDGFMALSEYLKEKSNLFPGLEDQENEIGHKLAVLNIKVVASLEKCKEVLNSYGQEVKDQKLLLPYLQRFMLLQSLHERAASSQERYEQLGKRTEYKEILEGFGELLNQLSQATKILAQSMLLGQDYRHPISIGWILSALEFEIEKMHSKDKQLLVLLLHNLTRSHVSLQKLNSNQESTSPPRLQQDDRTLWERIKDQLNWKHPRLKYAIRLSSCFLIGSLLVMAFELPKGEWIMLTSLFVNQPTYSETRRRLFQRVLGTISGVVLGVLIIQILPTQIGQTLLMLTSAYFFAYWRKSNYSLAVVFITIYVLGSNNLITHSGISMMGPRILATLTGALLAILSIRLLWPDWQHKRLPSLLSSALQSNALYFSSIIHAYQNPEMIQQDDYQYRIARRRAHKADNQLTLSWQSMRLEPKKQKRLMQHAFTLTYLNHSLLSYLSALGARRDSDHIDYIGFDKIAKQVNVVLQETSNHLTGESKRQLKGNLKPVLMQLREHITEVKDPKEQQQMRLLYNITGVSNKLLKTSLAINESIS
ncbi:FUSC family protein [bacterium]|nr:FUSC family protein [bacterium]